MTDKLDYFDKLQNQLTVFFDTLRDATKEEQRRFEIMQKEIEKLKAQKIDEALKEAFREDE